MTAATRLDEATHSGCCQEKLRDLVIKVQGVNLRRYELADVSVIFQELRPTTQKLVAEARTVLNETMAELEKRLNKPSTETESNDVSLEFNTVPFERAMDQALARDLDAYQSIESIIFIALIELRQRAERLERVTPANGASTILGECDSSLRRICKGLTAVDAAIAKGMGLPPLLAYTSELQRGLKVRQAYSLFRKSLLKKGEPSQESFRAHFRAVGTQIAMLVGWAAYPDMRIADRLLLLSLQQRVLAWLRGDNSPSHDDSLRLWQDIAACLEMLGLVNKRQELVEHDRVMLEQCIKTLENSPANVPIHVNTWQKLSMLMGLDKDLDVVLSDNMSVPNLVMPHLLRIFTQYSAATTETNG